MNIFKKELNLNCNYLLLYHKGLTRKKFHKHFKLNGYASTRK
jgi:hypothetical protein